MSEVAFEEGLRPTEQALSDALYAVTGDRAANPFTVFPNPAPYKRRQDVEWPTAGTLDDDQQAALREAIGRLGPGRLEDRGPAGVGFERGDYVALNQGGTPAKEIAQLAVLRQGDSLPNTIFQSASRVREIDGNERAFAAAFLGIALSDVGGTEYEVAQQLLLAQPGFIPNPARDPIGSRAEIIVRGDAADYRQFEPHASIEEPVLLGMLPSAQIGEGITYAAVYMLGIRPDSHAADPAHARASIADQVAYVAARTRSNHIGIGTSATYQPSVELQRLQALRQMESNVNVQVMSYGRQTFARVNHKDTPEPPSLPQLAAEAYVIAESLNALRPPTSTE